MAAQAGDLFGAKALLVGRLVSLDVKQASIKQVEKKVGNPISKQ